MKRRIWTRAAPAVIGVTSQGIGAGGWVHVAAQLGFDAATMELAEGAEAQARRCVDNVEAVARAAGLALAHAVHLQVFVVDMKALDRVNAILAERLAAPWPALTAAGVTRLERGALVAIAATLRGD